MGRYFGTDGFRGRANESLTAVHAFRVGRFLGRYFMRGKRERVRIVVGKDTRLSSYMFEYAFTAGATASGADVYLLHVTTTPSVSYVTRTEGFDCGVMISASHNPYADNGIKLMNSEGEKMEGEAVSLLEDYLDGGTLPFAEGEEIGRTVDYVAGRNRYLGYLLSLPRTSLRGLRVGLDCANGSAWAISKAVFDALGAHVTLIGAEPNGVNINDGCGSTHPERLCALVKSRSLDVGFAFDGDADRCICVDERGEIVDGDGILYVCALQMKAEGEPFGGQVVATVMSNTGLQRSLAREGIGVRITDVGDKAVYAQMRAANLLLGGEASGHIVFLKHAATGDGILTALKIAETLMLRKCPLSCLTRGYVPLVQKNENCRVKDKPAALHAEGVRLAAEEGKRLLGEGRLLLRASGTEPVVRIMAEGENAADCDEAVRLVLRALHACEEEL